MDATLTMFVSLFYCTSIHVMSMGQSRTYSKVCATKFIVITIICCTKDTAVCQKKSDLENASFNTTSL